MELEELHKLVTEVQHRRMEPDAVEVKAAHGGTPKLFDSLSAFANRPGGGIILLGLDEKQNFKVVGVGNPQRAQEDIANWARAANTTHGRGKSPCIHSRTWLDQQRGMPRLVRY